ncbi:MAG: PilZ domain-containing protein [Treponema sp.]|nr:PilZ domain-containing protein [Treponema sp.]
MDATGSPLAARQTALPYTVMAFALVGIGVLFLLWIVWKILQKRKESPEYIEAQKNRPTTIKDVQALTKKISLTRQEALLLYNICFRQKARNIYYLWNDEEYLDGLLREEFLRLRQKNAESDVYEVFKLKSRLEKIERMQHSIPSSHNIPEGETLTLPVTGGRFYSFKIRKNDQDSLVLEVPKNLEGTEFCPKPLDKIVMTYMTKRGTQYVLSSRVIRFQHGAGGVHEMVINHSNAVSMQNRRQWKRINIGNKCLFSAVEEKTGRRGEVTYSPKENKYEGTLADVSAGGCMIKTQLPIKRDQKLWIKINLPERGEFEAYGLIVSAQKNNETNEFGLHISFIEIDEKDRNDIFAFVYNY